MSAVGLEGRAFGSRGWAPGLWEFHLFELFAVLLAAFCVRLMDDAVDADVDGGMRERTWASLLGQAATPYSLAALAAAAMFHAPSALSLFAAAYFVGMAHEPGRRLISGLRAWQEGAVLLAAAAAAFGPLRAAWAVCVTACIQLVDDLQDLGRDRSAGIPNWAERLGPSEARLAAFAFGCLAAVVHGAGTLCAAGAAAGLAWGERRAGIRRGGGEGDVAGP